LNLVVKVILHQFGLPQAKTVEALEEATQVLVDLPGDIEAVMDNKGDNDP
jgi:hypothetical protein